MTLIGSSPARPDGRAKVTGEAAYADDFTLPGLWFGATVRSPHPHARLGRIGWRGDAPAEAVLVTAADLPGPNGVQLIDDRWPILADGVVRHFGEPVALVAAPTRLAAQLAAREVAVEYEPLPAIVDLESADPDQPLASYALDRGDVDAALEACDHVLEGIYSFGHQEHIYIECQAMTAWFDEAGRVEVVGSMQCPYYVHKAFVHAFGLEEDQIRIRASVVGGGFGGKEDFPSLIALHCALLSRACGRPVRIAYERQEDIIGTTKRHPGRVRHRTGFAADGTLQAMDIDILFDGGAYLTLSGVVLSRGLLHATGPYRCPAVRVRAQALRTHTAPNGAFRGFGAPQTQFAAERQMDRIGRRLGLDPAEIRRRNVLEPGDRLPTGQVLDASASGRRCLEEAVQRTGFLERWHRAEAARDADPEGPRVGVGLSLFFHGAGFTGNGERRMRSPVTVRLDEQGRVEVLTAMTDMGQGCSVVFPQLAATAAGIGLDDLSFPVPDTSIVPDSGPTVASRTTMIVGATITRAVQRLTAQVLDWWESQAGFGALTVVGGEVRGPEGRATPFREVARQYRAARGSGELTEEHRPPDWQQFDESTYQGAAYPTYSWGADVAEVEVDPDTLSVRATALTAVCEVGRVIHPILCAGQIEGGTLQAVGYALWEEVKMEEGRYLNDRLATYIIPTIKDSPRFEVHLLESPWEGGPFGAKGVGELPMDGGAPAVVAAIENAIGLEVDTIPATPERLLAAELAGRRVEGGGGA